MKLSIELFENEVVQSTYEALEEYRYVRNVIRTFYHYKTYARYGKMD